MCGAKAGRGVRYVLAAQAGEVPEEQDLMNHGEDQHSRPVWKYPAGSSVQRFAPCYLLGRLTSEVERRESCCMPMFKLLWFPYFRILTQDPAEAKRHSHHLAGVVAACSKPMMKMLWFLPALCTPRWGNESPPAGASSSKASPSWIKTNPSKPRANSPSRCSAQCC